FHSDLIPPNTMLATPMRHRGEHVGTFFLGDKEGEGGFTEEDEELLVLFASQAASALANARAHSEERRARAHLEALVETSPVGVVVFDARTAEPAALNREARRIVEALGRPGNAARDLLGELTARLAGGRELTLDELRNAERLRGAEVELSVPGGRSIRVLVNTTPIRTGEEVESVVVTMQDLAPLEELERLRIEFLGMVSHELRAPLASIKGSTTTLLNAPRDLDRAETRQFIRIIDQGADQMQGLIGDLLDAGRIHAGTLSVDPEAMEVTALVEQARTTFPGGGGRQVLRVDLAPDLPRVMADERRIVQVLNNLIGNAARHSPESSPIEVGAAREGDGVALWVADEGRGFSPEQLPHLFRRYAEGDAAGFGLGLVVCRGLVEAHGGRIRAESAGPGLGARFTFTLQAEEAAAAAPRANGPAREAATVLVVDDDPETLRHVREALTAAGYAALVTGEADEAARLVRTERPDLVLLDLMLPGRDGVEFMRETPELSDLPVIIISGYGREETIVRALEAGAADYVVKPFSAAELTARVGAALRHREGAEPFALGDLAIDYERREVTVGGRPVELTATEYELLRVLSVNAGRVMSTDALLRRVWARREDATVQEVRNFVKKLRRKLGDEAASPSFIRNVRGVGYKMPAPGEA
ncbi:MAG: response regulator, partial [Nitrospinae bacterium]|nr:response regulator [Nitrospinota bacterium]